jgi:hypothetical protein
LKLPALKGGVEESNPVNYDGFGKKSILLAWVNILAFEKAFYEFFNLIST